MDDRDLEEILRNIPESLRLIVGDLESPNDEGLGMSEAIVEGRCIGASDGSLKKGFQHQQGAHGYALRENGSGGPDIKGYDQSPESAEMSSLTTEHYGLIGLLTILHILCKKYRLRREECFDEVKIYIDNKTVVERCKKEQDLINLSDYSVPDQDLWSLTTELLKKMPIKVEVRWVRGHQDENRYGEKIHGPFSKEVQMNILVDELAGRRMGRDNNTKIKRPTFKSTVISLYDKDEIYITDVRKHMVEKVNGKRMIDYYKKLRGWKEADLKNIQWEGINGMLKKATPMRRIKLVKLVHNWQNTGKQKGKIRDARLKINSDNPLQPTIEEEGCHLCPEGCKEIENDQHYLHCKQELAVQARNKSIKKVIRRLRALRTSDHIIGLIGHILKAISNREEVIFDLEEMKIDEGSWLAKAVDGQQKIGWMAMCQGFFHKGWAVSQAGYYKRLGLKTRYYNIGSWKSMMSTIMGDYSLECWERRNKSIHGDNKAESRTKKLKKLRQQVGKLYRKKTELQGTNYNDIFKMPKVKRQNMGIQATTLWIDMAEEALRMHRENATKNTIHQWLQSR